jgi:flavin reductase (DIM6/NTAB) family NADH-FMN oxidoreductase RutF
MKEAITPKKALRLINHGPVVLVTTLNHAGKPNVATIGWVTPISMEPTLVAIGVNPDSYTCELLRETREFVLNIPNTQLLNETHYFGSVSGREVDKLQTMELTRMAATHVNPPLIRECIGHLECHLYSSAPMGDHHLFVGEVVAASVEDELFDGHWKTEEPAAKTIHHLGGDFYTTIGRRAQPKDE